MALIQGRIQQFILEGHFLFHSPSVRLHPFHVEWMHGAKIIERPIYLCFNNVLAFLHGEKLPEQNLGVDMGGVGAPCLSLDQPMTAFTPLP